MGSVECSRLGCRLQPVVGRSILLKLFHLDAESYPESFGISLSVSETVPITGAGAVGRGGGGSEQHSTAQHGRVWIANFGTCGRKLGQGPRV